MEHNEKSNDILVKILFWMGLYMNDEQKNGEGRCTGNKISSIFVLFGLILGISWNVIFIAKVGTEYLSSKASISLLLCPLLASVMWLTLFQKRISIKEILNKLTDIPTVEQRRLKTNCKFYLATTFLFVQPAVLGFIYVVETISDPDSDRFYTMTMSADILGTLSYSVFALISIYIKAFTVVIFPTIASFVFGTLCCRCRNKLLAIRRRLLVMKINPEPLKLRMLLQKYRQVLEVLTTMEEAFSGFSFIYLLVQFFNLFTGLSVLLLSAKSNIYKTSEISITIFIQCADLILVMAYAAEIPHTIRYIKYDLYDLNERLVFYSHLNKGKECLEALLQRETFALSAWGMVYFTRSLILGSIGTMLTYSLLIIQFNGK